VTSGRAWSSSTAVGTEPNGTLSAFQESLPVQLIATARRDFKTCLPDEASSVVIDRNRDDSFDFLPVVNLHTHGREAVIGLLDVTHLGVGPASNQVRDHMQPLGEDHLIGADASILTFLRDADRHPFRFVVSGHEINGLVSLSDLQRLPVRAALFALVTQLEMTMADVIRRALPDPDGWLRLLSAGRTEKVRGNVARARSEDTTVEWLLYTQFWDKVTIAAKVMTPPAGWPEGPFLKDMNAIQSLRNDLAHANDYAATREAARNVCGYVRAMDEWIRYLREMRA